jgi:hypothetical protein
MLSSASPRVIEIEANAGDWAMLEKVDRGKCDSLPGIALAPDALKGWDPA